jgi:uncharacterized protein involved in exopolysaccharide biosynthesis
MTEPSSNRPLSPELPEGSEEVSILDVLIVLAKHKRLIAIVTSSGALLSVIVSLLLPNIYTGTARVLPPQQAQSNAALLLGQLGGIAALAGGSLGIKNPSDLYVGMLKSRTVADSVIERFNLKGLYGKDTMVETRKVLSENTTITSGKEGLITIDVEDEDPTLAAEIANAYVEELDKLTQSLAVTEAAQRRLFFERQLHQAKEDLSAAEIALKKTQETTGLIKLDDQGKAIIEAVAALRAQISAKEVEVRSLRTFATEQNPDYVRIQSQLAALRSELAKLERAQISGGGDILLPTGKVPEAGLEYVRKFRDVKYSETLFELLAKNFEVAKIDEAKEAAIIQIVDRAVVPDRKSKPRRGVIAIVATVLAALLSCICAFIREAAQRDPLKAERLATLRRYVMLR